MTLQLEHSTINPGARQIAKAVALSSTSIVIVIGSLLVAQRSLCAERFVAITAEIALTSYIPADTNGTIVEKHRTYLAKCTVGTNEWRIDSGFTPNLDSATYFDGTNIFHRLRITKAPPQHTNAVTTSNHRATLPFEQARSNVTVSISASPGGHPLGNLGVNIPWMVYCSGTYLRLPGRTIPLPTIDIRGAIDAFSYVDKTESIDDELGLPKAIDLLTSQERFRDSLADHRLVRSERLQEAKARPVSPYSDAILKFRYVADEITNFSGWHLPTRFAYVTYRPTKKGHWEPLVSGTGTLLSIAESSRPEHVLVPGAQQTIVDYRFRHETRVVDAIIYGRTNIATAPRTNDPDLRTRFQARAKRAPLESAVLLRRSRYVFSAILCTLIAWPVICMSCKRLGKGKLKQ